MINNILEYAGNFHFMRPWMLFLLVIPAIFYFKIFKGFTTRSSWEKICDKNLLEYLLVKGHNGRRKFSIFMIYFGLAAAAIAAAGPSWQKEERPALNNIKPVMLLLNMSSDMLKDDVKPNRLMRAKIEISQFLSRHGSGETGLIVYAAEPFLISPLSADDRLIKNLLPSINMDIMPSNGDMLYRAIDLAVDKIQAAGFIEGNIVVFAADSGMQYEAALKSAKKAAAAGINVSVVDIGKTANAKLQEIADSGSGIFAAVSDNQGSMNSVINFLHGSLNKQWQEGKNQIEEWSDGGWYFLFLPMICALYFFRRGLLVILLVLTHSFSAQAGFFINNNQEAAAMYDKGEYINAAQKFTNLPWKAASFYRAGDYNTAADIFLKGDGIENMYNYGNALAKSGKIEEAINAYEQVLKQNPNHQDAKYNLEYLKQQQNQQQNQQNNENQNNSERHSSDKQQTQDKSDSQKSQAPENSSESNGKEPEAQEQNAAGGENQEQSRQEEQEDKSGQRQPHQATEQNADSEMQNLDSSEQNENTNKQKEEQQAAAAKAKEAGNDEQYDETVQAREQQFREIPDDPGGLLRAFIYKEYMKNRYGE